MINLELYEGPGRRIITDDEVKEIVHDEAMERAHDRKYRDWLIASGKLVPGDNDGQAN